MFCFKCGKQISENLKFCKYCGQKQTDNEEFQSRYISIEDRQKSVEKLRNIRNKWIGSVLIIFSILAFIGIAMSISEGNQVSTNALDSSGMSPIPYIFDVFIAIQLLRQKEDKYLNWLFLRVILGLVIWGLLAMSEAKWGELIVQALYSSYFIFLIKAPLSEKSLKIANLVILPLVIISLFFV